MSRSEEVTQIGRFGVLLVGGQAENIADIHAVVGPTPDFSCNAGCAPAPCVWLRAARKAIQVERDVNGESEL